MQSQTLTQTHHQPLSTLKVWLKTRVSSSNAPKPHRIGQNAAAYQRAPSVQTSSPAILQEPENSQSSIAQSQVTQSFSAHTSATPAPSKVTATRTSIGQFGRKSKASAHAAKKFETEEARAQSLIQFHGSAQDALVWAVEKKHQRAIFCLLDHGINDAEPTGFRRCLSLSLQQSNYILLGQLLDTAKRSDRLKDLLRDSDLLRMVAQNDNNNRLDSLLDALDGHGKRLVMFTAVEHAISNIVPRLLTMGTDSNACFYGRSILPRAVSIGYMDNISALLNFAYTNVNALAKARHDQECLRPAIEVAAAAQNITVLEQLLKRGDIDVNLADSQGNVALVAAAKMGADTRALALLLKRGDVDVNKANSQGNTALHVAAKVGSVPVVKLLLENGANPVQKNLKKRQAVQVAGDEGNEAVFNYFRERIGLPPVTAQQNCADGWDVQSSTGVRRLAVRNTLWPDREIRDRRTGEVRIVPPSEPVYWY